jgi:hypothetical protein
LALAALAHLSSTVVLAVLVAVLLALDERRRPRVVGCVMAAALVVMYYLHFLPLVLQVLPRLAEGASAGGRSLGLLEAMLRQLQEPVGRWGLPMVLLAAAGLARGAEREPRPLLAAAGISALALAVVACVSPLEVRFVYAVAFAVAIVAADGLRRLSGAGRVAQAVALGLLTWQVTLAVSGLREILLERYRPHP